jgi:hypothetical protein
VARAASNLRRIVAIEFGTAFRPQRRILWAGSLREICSTAAYFIYPPSGILINDPQHIAAPKKGGWGQGSNATNAAIAAASERIRNSLMASPR